MTTRRDFVIQSAALAVSVSPMMARAQSFPLAKVIAGFPPGGTIDAMARRIAEKLNGSYASTILVENKPGAAGQIGITTLRDSAPDGSVMMLTPSSMLSIFPYVYKTLPYKPLEDVQPVSLACYYNHALAVGPAVPQSVKTLKDFLAWAKANPEHATYGSPSAGSMAHLIGVMLNKFSGVNIRHVPYRGAAPGVQDLMGGQISSMSAPVGSYLPHLKSGRLRVLTISGLNRSPFIPDVPTYRQHGFPITVREWNGLFLPGKASAEPVRRAAAYVHAALAEKDLISSMAQLGLEVQSSTPAQLADLLRSDTEEWRRLIKQIGFTPES